MIGYLCFKRLSGSLEPSTTAFIRWLLFLPAGLLTGAVAFGIFTLVARGSDDEDVSSMGGVLAGALGGACSVLIGIAVAPRYPRVVAIIMATACSGLATSLYCWTRASCKGELALSAAIVGGVYSFSAIAAAVSVVRLETNRTVPNHNT